MHRTYCRRLRCSRCRRLQQWSVLFGHLAVERMRLVAGGGSAIFQQVATVAGACAENGGEWSNLDYCCQAHLPAIALPRWDTIQATKALPGNRVSFLTGMW